LAFGEGDARNSTKPFVKRPELTIRIRMPSVPGRKPDGKIGRPNGRHHMLKPACGAFVRAGEASRARRERGVYSALFELLNM
jgi:hypothetical protein